MNAISWTGRLLLLGTLVVAVGCPPAGTPTGKPSNVSVSEDPPAIKEARQKDDGQSLAPKESREVTTVNGIVIVSKDADGKVTYKMK